MAAEIPVVRLFVACHEIQIEPDSPKVSLRHLFHRVVRLPGEPLPCVREQMALYALLTNGRGAHSFHLELAFLDQGDERVKFQSPSRQVDLGQDPVTVLGLPITRMRVQFDQAGQYTFYLVCDGRRIADCHVEVS